jgi:hypothetical protein
MDVIDRQNPGSGRPVFPRTRFALPRRRAEFPAAGAHFARFTTNEVLRPHRIRQQSAQ